MDKRRKAPRRADPDFVRRLLQVQEDLQALAWQAESYPVGTCVPAEWDHICERLNNCSQAVDRLTRAGQLDPSALRQVYDEMVEINAEGHAVMQQIEGSGTIFPGSGALVAEWRVGTHALMARGVAGLRELVVLTSSPGVASVPTPLDSEQRAARKNGKE